jgi:hypothetical protein
MPSAIKWKQAEGESQDRSFAAFQSMPCPGAIPEAGFVPVHAIVDRIHLLLPVYHDMIPACQIASSCMFARGGGSLVALA